MNVLKNEAKRNVRRPQTRQSEKKIRKGKRENSKNGLKIVCQSIIDLFRYFLYALCDVK